MLFNYFLITKVIYI